MKVARVKLSDQVAEQLQTMIRSGEYKEGDRLPTEGVLAEKFAVSRITVREAVSKLRAMDLIEVRQGEGTFVKKLTPASFMKPLLSMLTMDKKNLRDIFEVRIMIECKAAELAALRAGEETVKKLGQLLERMDQCIMDNTLEQYNALDAEFHLEILRSSGNRILVAFGDMSTSMIRDSITAGIALPNALANSIILHKRIFDAIKGRNANDAVAFMKQHLEGTVSYAESM